MVIAAILRFFPRFGDLTALSLILDGLTPHDGQENTRFPEFIRPHLHRMKWEMERSYASKSSFLVHRVKTDIVCILEKYTDNEAKTDLLGTCDSLMAVDEVFADR